MGRLAPTLIGVPFDGSSSFMAGPAEAPAAVRGALHCGSANWTSERGVDLDPANRSWTDEGDLDLPNDARAACDEIRAAASTLGADGGRLVALGGDHLITFPLVEALSVRHADVTILHIDAHPDLYDHLDGERLSHACPFARIMEARLASRLVQFGIRTLTAHQAAQAERFDVEIHTAADWDGVLPPIDGDVYISIDVDGLDPAFAPGVSHHEPGGLTTRQVLGLTHQVAMCPGAWLVGADVVEINPKRDINEMTAMLGAKLVKELLAAMIESGRAVR